MPVNRMLTVRLAVQTESDLELIQALDFDPELPCESPKAHGEAAVWIAKCKKCPHSALLCDEHRTSFVRFLHSNPPFYCGDCGLVGFSVEDSIDFVPIKAARDANR